MYKNLVTSDSVMNMLIIEQQNVADTEEKLNFTRAYLADFINQCNGFKSSLAVHEFNLKHLEAQVNVINRTLEEKESMLHELQDSTKGLGEQVFYLRDQVSKGEANLSKILQAQTDIVLELENLGSEKAELEQRQNEQKKLVFEAPSDGGVGFFNKIKRQRHASLLQGELAKLSNQIQDNHKKQIEISVKIERLKVIRKQQHIAIQNNTISIASTEKTIQRNSEILQTHIAEVKRLRTEAQGVSLRYRIVTEKVVSLREQIVEKQQDIANCLKEILELERTLAQRKASVIEKQKKHAEVSDEVTLAIIEED